MVSRRKWAVLVVAAVLLTAGVSTSAARSQPAQPGRDLASRTSFVPVLDSSDNPGVGTSDRTMCTTSGDPTAQIDINCRTETR